MRIALAPSALEPLAQRARALDEARALPVEQVRIDRVDSVSANRFDRREPAPRVLSVAESGRDDDFGARGEQLLARDQRGEGFRRGENVAPAAGAQRVAREVSAVHGEHGRVPDLQEHRYAALVRVALAQLGDIALESLRARLRDLVRPGEPADESHDPGYVDQGAGLGDEDRNPEALEAADLQRRVAALPGEHELRTKRDHALQVDPAVARDHGQARRFRRIAGVRRDPDELRAGTRGE